MNKAELIEHIAEHADLSKAGAARAGSGFGRGDNDVEKQGRSDFGGFWNFCGEPTRCPRRAQSKHWRCD